MLTLPSSVKIYVPATPIDARKSFDGLAPLVQSEFGLEPLSGHLFASINRRGHIAQLLFWGRSGFILLKERLKSLQPVWVREEGLRSRRPPARSLRAGQDRRQCGAARKGWLSALVTVDGSRTVSVGGDQSTTVTKKETQKYNDARTMDVALTNADTITGAHTGTYKTGRTLTVSGADDVLNVNGVNRTTTVKGKYAIEATTKYSAKHKTNELSLEEAVSKLTNGKCTLTFDGTTAKITAADELKLECGGSSITLTKDGTITISASHTVTASGAQGAMELSPTGGKLSGLMCTVSGSTASEVTGGMVKIN